jgi:hypothetical protein
MEYLFIARSGHEANRQGDAPCKLVHDSKIVLFCDINQGLLGADMEFLGRVLLAGAIVLALCGMGSRPTPGFGDNLTRYQRALISYFRVLNLLPIFVPEGQDVGDVYDSANWTFQDRADKCFPELPTTPPVSSTLPGIIETSRADAIATLGIFDEFGGSVSGALADVASIQFRDVQIKKVAAGDLRDHLSSRCAYLSDLVQDVLVTPGNMLRAPVVIGRVVYGRATVFVGITKQADANLKANVDAVVKRVAHIEGSVIPADVAAKLGFVSENGVFLESSESVPIAFAPAFLAKELSTSVRGSNGEATKHVLGYEWQPFAPEENSLQGEEFQRLLDTRFPELKH